jgi:hypothetical protein
VSKFSSHRWPNISSVLSHWLPHLLPHLQPGDEFLISVTREAEGKKSRHLAATVWGEEAIVIMLSPKLEQLPKSTREGVILHEFGHLMLGPTFHTERQADEKAESMFDVAISYDPVTLIQTTGPGLHPRPLGLK